MATEKKKNGTNQRVDEENERPQKKKSGNSSAAKKTSSGKKNTAKEPLSLKESSDRAVVKKKQNDPSSTGNQLVMILLAVIALFIIVCFIFKDDVCVLGKMLVDGCFGLFGLGAVLIPLLLLQLALFWKRDVASGAVKYKYIVSIFTLIVASVLLHSIWSLAAKLPKYTFATAFAWENLKTFFPNGIAYKGGGFFGGFFASALICVIGYPGTMIFGIVVLVLLLMTLFGLTPGECMQRVRFYLRLSRDKRRLQEQEKAQKQKEQES